MADWQKGDLALCVREPENPALPSMMGKVFTVSGVDREVDCFGEIGLWFFEISIKETREWASSCAASRFRKVTPPKADEFDREVIELMNGQPAEYRGKSPMRTSWWEAVS